MADEDLKLIRMAEQALAEIDRTDGLNEEHADVLAALRIRIHGGPKKTLDDALKAAGEMKGRHTLENPPPPKKKPSLDDALGEEPKKRDWPG